MNTIRNDLTYMESRIGAFSLRNLRRVDLLLTLLTLCLAAVGLFSLYSATYGSSSGLAASEAGRSMLQTVMDVANSWFGRQIIYFCAGLALAIVIICFDYRLLVSLAPLIYAIILGLLGFVLIAGHEAKGGQRWIDLGVFHLQPSEFAKVALIYMLAWYFAKLGNRIRKIPYFILAFVIVGIPCGLIFLQPSLSAALSLMPVVAVMLFAAGCRLWHMMVLVVLGLIPVFLVVYQVRDYQAVGPQEYSEREYPLGVKLKGYQIDRILTFVDPYRDPKDKGYQSIQMRITVGSGEFRGKGFCQGTQTHLSFLPEFHTDLIFALLAEEWGFVGASTVIVLFVAFFLRGLDLARSAPDPAGSLLAVGCVTILAFHTVTNIAITVGLLPVTGMPLPFLSYGGSFYLTTMACVGTLLSVHVRRGPRESDG